MRGITLCSALLVGLLPPRAPEAIGASADPKVHLRKRHIALWELAQQLHRQTGLRFSGPRAAFVRRRAAVPTGPQRLSAVLDAVAKSAHLDWEPLAHRGELVICLWEQADPVAVPRLVKLAASRDEEDRCVAARWLPRAGTRKALRAALLLLGDRSRRVRNYASTYLARQCGLTYYHSRISPVALLAPRGIGKVIGDVLRTRPLPDKYALLRLAAVARDPGVVPALRKMLEPIYEQHGVGAPPKGRRYFDASTFQNICLALGHIGGAEAEAELLATLKKMPAPYLQFPLQSLGLLGTPRATAALTALLASDNLTLRRGAAWALARPGRVDAVAPLIRVLHDKKEVQAVRSAALHALSHIGTPKAVDAVIAEFRKETDPRRRAGLCMTLSRHAAAATAIVPVTQSDVERTRQAAVTALGLTRSLDAVPVLLPLLKHKDKGTRSRAALSLGRIGGTKAVTVLIARLADEDINHRCSAAQALGDAGDPAAAPALRRALNDADPRLRALAARSLGKLGDAGSIDALLAASRMPRKKDPYNSADAAIRQLGLIGGKRAARELLGAAKTSHAAAQALLYSPDPECIRAARRGLTGDDPALRRALAVAVDKRPPLVAMQAAEPLRAILTSPKERGRTWICKALRQLKDPRATADLMEALVTDQDADVRYYAALALSPGNWDGLVDPMAASALVEAAKSDKSAPVRRVAKGCLFRLDIADRPDIAPILKRPTP